MKNTKRNWLVVSFTMIFFIGGFWALHWSSETQGSLPVSPRSSASMEVGGRASFSDGNRGASLAGEAAKMELKKGGDFESLGEALSEARHAAVKIDPGGEHSRRAEYFAANPGQQLRVWFSEDGVELASGLPALDEETPWSLRLRLQGVGRGNNVVPVESGVVVGEGRRVEIEHANVEVTQWFENSQAGLEQGFALQREPEGASGEVLVSLRVDGDLRARMTSESEGVCFVDSDEVEVLHYGKLKVWDATGRELRARMDVRGSELTVVVFDAGAQYPVIIDPLFTNVEARLAKDSAVQGEMGYSVALAGDTALLGVPRDDTIEGADVGSAFIFSRSGSVWIEQGRLTADDATSGDSFGLAVALTSDTALIGAPRATIGGQLLAGSSYVFVRNGVGWSQQQKLFSSISVANAEFGQSVALEGDTALIGAPEEDAGSEDRAGFAYLFERSGTAWAQDHRMSASDAAEDDEFGESVALSGDSALIGARGANQAYVFDRSLGAWTEQDILGPGVATSGSFGHSVSLSGETALVGAREGERAYVFVRNGMTWNFEGELAPWISADEFFGTSVALVGDRAVVGAEGTSVVEGSAYVFVRTGEIWSPQQRLAPSGVEDGDWFGHSVALSGLTIVVGAFGDDTLGGENSGSGYVFVRSGGSWNQEDQLTRNLASNDDKLGSSVALFGDLALVGAGSDDTEVGPNTGSAYTFIRSGMTWGTDARLIAPDAQTADNFGGAVALHADTALVGAGGDDSVAGLDSGSAHVFVRNDNWWSYQDCLLADDAAAHDAFGISVSLADDTALVGAYRADSVGGTDAGAAYTYTRSAASWSQQQKLTSASPSLRAYFGIAVALSGDTALIGAFGDDTVDGVDAGSAWVFVHDGTSWGQEMQLTASSGAGGDLFGSSVALEGDLAVVGSPRSDLPFEANAGGVYVFERSGATWNQEAELRAIDAAEGDLFGISVSLSAERVLVGAKSDDLAAGVDAGSAYLFDRNSGLWSQQLKFTSGFDASPGDEFGQSVALSGDAAVIGAPLDDTAEFSAGSVYAYLIGVLPEIVQHPQSRTVPLTVPGVDVEFTVFATGSGVLESQWRKDGASIPGASGVMVDGSSSFVISAVTEGDAGLYDVVVSNAGGTVTSAPAFLSVNSLSELSQAFPGPSGNASGFVLTIIDTPISGTGWRFRGELQWRTSGVPVGGMTTGDRVIEFRPVPGFIHPPAETVTVISGGAATLLTRSYYSTGAAGSGGVTVVLKPDSIADALLEPVTARGQWRFLGEDDLAWRNSGVTVSDLVPGSYLIECKEVPDRTTPPTAVVAVVAGAPPAPILTYFLPEATSGTEPSVLPFETVSTSTGLPYAYVGQIRSDLGASTGFVVRERVVATAGHVVFDDGSLAAVTGLQWLFQRDKGTYEPEPMEPRGFYLFDGYSAQRTLEGTPGSSTPASQELDVAALYFDVPAGRGGFGGFLASDAANNEWLLSSAQKILVGYPVEGVAAGVVGRMHATPAANVGFGSGGSVHTYTTTDIRSFGGNSGGPLCVQLEGGAFYPAAIYLGGTGQSVVRVIDSDVIQLFDAAENSAATGGNNTGGGITLTSVIPVGAPEDPGILVVNIEPEEARSAGAGWRLVPATDYRPSGALLGSLNPGTYVLEFPVVSGFAAPTQETVEVTGGATNIYTYPYVAESSELEAWRFDHFGTTENTGDAANGEDPDGDGETNEEEFAAGTDPNGGDDAFRVVSAERLGGGFALGVEGKLGRVYELQMFVAPTSGDPADLGSWVTRASVGPLGGDVAVSLVDPVSPVAGALYRVRVMKP